MATKRRKGDSDALITDGGSNPLYMPPQDVLSFVPESESTEYRILKKEREM